jgi:S1-C subfamily serine protease
MMINKLPAILRRSICLALIPPTFLNCVVALGTADNAGKTQWVASGFLYGEKLASSSNRYTVFLVTARHVVNDLKDAIASGHMMGHPATSVVMRFNPEVGEAARQFSIPLERWVMTDDQSNHAAVAPIDPDFLRSNGVTRLAFFESDLSVANKARAKELGLSEGDGVYVLGFPLGLVEQSQHSFVIVRGGTIARIGDCLAGERQTFLIDSMIFPGNSGGPVVNRPETGAVQGTRPQNAAYLIGFIEGYIPYEDYAVSAQTQRARVIFEENSGLAEVIPVDAVQQVVKQAIAKLASGK